MKIISYRILFISLILGITISANLCHAQLGQAVSQGDLYAPPSPNSAALARYANVPVDEHTGIASVVLPIDKLSGRQLSVPITLSYHGAGNKVQDLASNVGLGFVLNSGGVITRDMRGLPDESNNGYQYYGKMVYSNTKDSAYLNATMNGKMDGEPDIFYFNFLGHTGKMVIDTLGNAQYLPDQGIRVIRHPIHNNPDSTNNSWILKDLSGATYEFGVDTNSRELTVAYMNGQPLSKVISYVSSWYLVRVTSPDGKETINFSYKTGPNMSYEQYRNIMTYQIHDDMKIRRKTFLSSKVTITHSYSPESVKDTDVSTFIKVISPKYLSSIYNDMGSLTFSYIPRQDVSGGMALNQMNVYNIDDSATPIKTYTFNQSYFLSPNPNSPTDPDSKRLRLDCVDLQGRGTEIKQLFVFSYNEQTLLPPRNSDSFDHWGYFTTLDNRAGLPPVNLVQVDGNYEAPFEERAPDSTKMQACILTKIRNVNGGYTALYYQPNYYQYNGSSHFGGGLRIRMIVQTDSLGQVTPLVTQYSYTLDNGSTSGMIYNPKPYYIQGITNYQANEVVQPIPSLLSVIGANFKNPLTDISLVIDIALIGTTGPLGLVIDLSSIILVPAFIDIYDFIFKRTTYEHIDSPPFSISSCPLNNLFDANGASVSYSQVKKINADGSYNINYYTGQQDYPDSASAVVLNLETQPVKIIYGNSGSYPPNTSFDFERGLLKQGKAYDKSGNLVSQVTNTYKLSKRAGSVAGQRSSVSGYATLSNGAFQVITYDVGIYNEISENIQMSSSITQLFDQDNSGNALIDTTNYAWQPNYPTLIHSQSTKRSDGKWLVNYTTYPMEYAPGTQFLDDMVRHYMLAVPIEEVSTLQSPAGVSITGGMINRYKPGGAGLMDTVFSLTASNPIPSANFKFSNQALGSMGTSYRAYGMDKRYIAKAFYQAYDSKNNLVQSQNLGEPSSSIIWGYNQDVPIAQISNAAINQVAYTGFETNDQQYWSFTNSGRDSSGQAKTGKIRYQLSNGPVSNTKPLPAGTYLLSLWTQGTKPSISGAAADVSVVNGESDGNTWNFYMDRITVAANATVSLSGSGFIDELRLYPQGAHMSTVSISPQVGVLATCSQDDKVNSYEYDGLQRLVTERNDQYNVLKQYAYSNVAAVPCIDVPDLWQGIDPICFTDQTHIVPDSNNYTAQAVNSYGNLVCTFTRTAAEQSYLGEVDYTVNFSDNRSYSNTILMEAGSQNAITGFQLNGESPESITGIVIDSIINLTDNYGELYQSFKERQRIRDGYTEANTYNGGIGPYIAPILSSTGCPTLFSNTVQTNFYKNNCATGDGSEVVYVVPAGTYTAGTQFAADSIARAAGQAYANANGTCSADTSWVGSNPYCSSIPPTSGTPVLSAYSIATNYLANFGLFYATVTRSAAEAAHDANVSYTMSFIDGTSQTFITPMYENQQSINFTLPITGYLPSNVTSTSITSVVYTPLSMQAYYTRSRLLDGVADGYSEPNTTGINYLAPIPDPAGCTTWFYNTPQSGFSKNDCTSGTGSTVNYTVPAHTDSSTVSQAYANALARARGQAYANANGTCIAAPDTLVSTVAGNGTKGYIDGPAATAEFSNVYRPMTIDASNNLYFADGDENITIRKLSSGGSVSTVAGTNTVLGYIDGTGTAASFSGISGLVNDANGNIFVADGYKIREVTPAGVVTTFAGSDVGYYSTDGQGTGAGFRGLGRMAIDQSGNMFVIEANTCIREITPSGQVTSITTPYASSGYVDGPISTARFTEMGAITIDKFGNIYLFDHYRIRKISGGIVSTFVGDGNHGFVDGTGTATEFGSCFQMWTDSQANIFIADPDNNCIRKITPAGVVTTINHTNLPAQDLGYVDGSIKVAKFERPSTVVVDSMGNLYLEDNQNYIIRKITFPPVPNQ